MKNTYFSAEFFNNKTIFNIMALTHDVQKEQKTETTPAYKQLVSDATTRVRTGQLAAFRAVNKELIELIGIWAR